MKLIRNLRPLAATAATLTMLAAVGGSARAAVRTHSATAGDYVPNQVVVGYAPGPYPSVAGDLASRAGAPTVTASVPAPQTAVLTLPSGVSVASAIARLQRKPGVSYVVPNYIAHTAGDWIPNDRGRSHQRGGWERLQWNFISPAGVDAPRAWANLIADHRPGGRGVTVAILDTGVAYRNWHRFKRSPDFNHTRFVDPYDFLSHNRYPLDREGHGTFVAGVVAESTNNRIGLTGLAYGASIMPLRVLNRDGTGDAATIARGVRYAVHHHAQIINLSLEFTPDVTAGDIPVLLSAIRYAVRHNVTIVAAGGNDYANELSYPARSPRVISVGATTRDRCVAIYSNSGRRLSLVAPGGGDDKSIETDPDCHADRWLPPVYQMTFFSSAHPARFGFPRGIYGTSMAAPEVSAAAAMVIASGVIGRHPTPSQIRTQLEQTAQPLGSGRPNPQYGWGLLDAGAATAAAASAAGSAPT